MSLIEWTLHECKNNLLFELMFVQVSLLTPALASHYNAALYSDSTSSYSLTVLLVMVP